MDEPLSICTVAYESSGWLALNRDLVARLNPGAPVHWWVAENTPEGGEDRLAPDTRGFEVVPGAPVEARAYGAGSYHHAAGLARVIPRVETRFLLILDPDFFLVREGWIREVLQYMEANGVAVLGAPWHPSRVSKIRYQPCAHCTFVDLKQIDRESLDFSPDYEGDELPDRYAGDGPSLLRRLDPLRLGKRRRIGSSKDTGWRLQRQWAADPALKVECLQPVFQPTPWQRAWERLFPDAMSLVPRRPGYTVAESFADAGIPGLEETEAEEFFWRGSPFGFHVRCHPIRLKRPETLAGQIARVKDVLESL